MHVQKGKHPRRFSRIKISWKGNLLGLYTIPCPKLLFAWKEWKPLEGKILPCPVSVYGLLFIRDVCESTRIEMYVCADEKKTRWKEGPNWKENQSGGGRPRRGIDEIGSLFLPPNKLGLVWFTAVGSLCAVISSFFQN